MKKITVLGKTDAIINLNKIGAPIRGRSIAILNITTEEQEKELMGVVRIGLAEIIKDVPRTPPSLPEGASRSNNAAEPKDVKKKIGRPKGSKNKFKNSLAEEEQQRVALAEAETQKMGSRVVIGTLDGPKVGRMRHLAVESIADSEKTQESLRTMEKLRKEEEEDISLPDTKIDDSELDASEQMGRPAVISTEKGTDKVDMVNSIIPESKISKDIDPFIEI